MVPLTSPRVHLVGQGAAGTALAWALWRAGRTPVIWDRGHAEAATRAGAGIMNPITGQRLVPSWKWAQVLPAALAMYRDIEYELGVTLLRPFRVRRLFADERERRIFERKRLTGELGSAVGEVDAQGFWIEGAWQVDSALLVEATRAFFRSRGWLHEEEVPLESLDGEPTVLCSGRSWPQLPACVELIPWEGAIVEFATEVLDPGVILNRQAWVMPLGEGKARVGSTYWPAGTPENERSAGLQGLVEEAALLVGHPVKPLRTLTGWRVATADRRPVLGWLDGERPLGILLGLGAKGAVQAPWLAGEWVAQLTEGRPFDPELHWRRFLPRS